MSPQDGADRRTHEEIVQSIQENMFELLALCSYVERSDEALSWLSSLADDLVEVIHHGARRPRRYPAEVVESLHELRGALNASLDALEKDEALK